MSIDWQQSYRWANECMRTLRNKSRHAGLPVPDCCKSAEGLHSWFRRRAEAGYDANGKPPTFSLPSEWPGRSTSRRCAEWRQWVEKARNIGLWSFDEQMPTPEQKQREDAILDRLTAIESRLKEIQSFLLTVRELAP